MVLKVQTPRLNQIHEFIIHKGNRVIAGDRYKFDFLSQSEIGISRVNG